MGRIGKVQKTGKKHIGKTGPTREHVMRRHACLMSNSDRRKVSRCRFILRGENMGSIWRDGDMSSQWRAGFSNQCILVLHASCISYRFSHLTALRVKGRDR